MPRRSRWYLDATLASWAGLTLAAGAVVGAGLAAWSESAALLGALSLPLGLAVGSVQVGRGLKRRIETGTIGRAHRPRVMALVTGSRLAICPGVSLFLLGFVAATTRRHQGPTVIEGLVSAWAAVMSLPGLVRPDFLEYWGARTADTLHVERLIRHPRRAARCLPRLAEWRPEDLARLLEALPASVAATVPVSDWSALLAHPARAVRVAAVAALARARPARGRPTPGIVRRLCSRAWRPLRPQSA